MNIAASKFNSRVKNIVSALLLLCVLVNGILWFNGISYSTIYNSLYRRKPGASVTHRQSTLPIYIDPFAKTGSQNLSVSIKMERVSPPMTKPTKEQPIGTSREPSSTLNIRPWPKFDIPSGVKIMKVQWNISDSAPTCQPTDLGPVFVPWSIGDLTYEVKTRYIKPRPGGLWAPTDCKPVSKVAIMVPYRNRAENLKIFVHHMHYFLQKQKLDYAIFVIEQTDSKRFNRAKLFNIGYIFTQLMHSYDCLVLHDIDKIPEDTSYSYACSNHPKHLPGWFRQASQGRNRHKYFPSQYYQGFFGGVSSLRKEHWLAINGMINSYWGWGGEDDELYMRLVLKRIRVEFTKAKNSKFVILYHKPDAVYSHRPMPKRKRVRQDMMRDGLNTVKFQLEDIKYEPLFTHIKVKL